MFDGYSLTAEKDIVNTYPYLNDNQNPVEYQPYPGVRCIHAGLNIFYYRHEILPEKPCHITFVHQYKIRIFDLVLNYYLRMTFSTHLLEEIEKQKLNDLEKRRQEILQLCVIELRKYFNQLNVKSLYITGSLLIPYKFRSQSDIDIAVEGLSHEKYFQAIFELGELLPGQVEIIELENCRFADKIIKTGLKII